MNLVDQAVAFNGPWTENPIYVAACSYTRVEGGTNRYLSDRVRRFGGRHDRTSFIEGQASWTVTERPDILRIEKPPAGWLDYLQRHEPVAEKDASGGDKLEEWPEPRKRARTIRHFDVLPDQICGNEAGFVIESWMRLDPTIEYDDILMRMHHLHRPTDPKSLHMRRCRIRNDLDIPLWGNSSVRILQRQYRMMLSQLPPSEISPHLNPASGGVRQPQEVIVISDDSSSELSINTENRFPRRPYSIAGDPAESRIQSLLTRAGWAPSSSFILPDVMETIEKDDDSAPLLSESNQTAPTRNSTDDLSELSATPRLDREIPLIHVRWRYSVTDSRGRTPQVESAENQERSMVRDTNEGNLRRDIEDGTYIDQEDADRTQHDRREGSETNIDANADDDDDMNRHSDADINDEADDEMEENSENEADDSDKSDDNDDCQESAENENPENEANEHVDNAENSSESGATVMTTIEIKDEPEDEVRGLAGIPNEEDDEDEDSSDDMDVDEEPEPAPTNQPEEPREPNPLRQWPLTYGFETYDYIIHDSELSQD